MNTLRIHSIETFGTHEGPGIRLVIFLQGCKLRCLYCHNPDTWNLNAGKETTTKELLTRVKHEIPYFTNGGGVTVTGGEPLLQQKQLLLFFKQLKKLGVHTGIDTNGFIFDDDTKKLLKYTDLVLLDIKHMDPDQCKKVTGKTNENALKFAEYLESIGKTFWIRCVLMPGYTDQDQNFRLLAEHFQNYKHLQRVEILPYHTMGVYKYKELGIKYKYGKVKPPTEEKINHALKIIKKKIKNVYVR